MILDKAYNAKYYLSVHPLFSKVMEYLEAYLEKPVPAGVYEICGKDLFVKVQDYETREKLYCASIYGGLAINVTGTCFPHTMGYLLTETFGIPHGTACAVFQKDFFEYNKAVVPALTAEYLERIGCSEEEYFRLLEVITPPCDIVMEETLIAASHSRWVNNGSMAKCQGSFTADMADAVLRRKFLAK